MDITHFRETLVREFGLDTYPPTEQDQYVEQLGELILQGILIKAVSGMDEAQAQELETIVERDGTPEEIFTYLGSTVQNLENLLLEEIAAVQADLAKTLETDDQE